MRTLPTPIADAFAARPRLFIGERKLSGRVTVTPDWYLNTAVEGLGIWLKKKVPLRWWQDAADDQIEVEIPNVVSIVRDRSIDNLATTCDIVILNQKMNSNAGIGHAPTELGSPGYFWPLRGASAESQSRWGQEPNEWSNILVQNAMIKVYQGITGPDPGISVADAVAAGYLIKRFVGLVDSPQAGTDGKLTLKCRGMAGPLLVDQKVDWPLIPLEDYPFERSRWTFFNEALHSAAKDVTAAASSTEPPGDRTCSYADSSTDLWSVTYGGGGSGSDSLLHGHRPTDSLDGDPASFWMSNGNSRADAAFAYDWVEYDCGGEAVNAVNINPWAGDFQVFISVMENGAWQGTDVIPYDPSELYGSQTVVDTGANIPYVGVYTLPSESSQEFVLPRVYAAQRIRVTLHLGTYTDYGPWHYRTGIREFTPRISAGAPTSAATVATQHFEPTYIAADDHPSSGYVTVDRWAQVDAFGEARVQKLSAGAVTSDLTQCVCITPDGLGYWLVDTSGRVAAYGSAEFFGDFTTIGLFSTIPCNVMACTPSGNGYWLLRQDGELRAFGDATNFIGRVPLVDWSPTTGQATGMDAMPTGQGIIVIDSRGRTYAYGTAADHGDFSPLLPNLPLNTPTQYAVRIRFTDTGAGYWILTNEGRVQHFGDAANIGGIAAPVPWDGDWRTAYWAIITVPGDSGYLLMRGDGSIFPIGVVAPVDFYGGPAQGSVQLRTDGNYKDLEEIVRDLLLYSGYFLEETVAATGEPNVFGVLETTGTWVNDTIKADQFDKKSISDAIGIIGDIVGYLLYENDDGSISWRSPNWWQSGNYDENAQHTDFIPEIDERIGMTGLGVSLPSRPLRSPIIVASSKPDPHNPSTTTQVSYVPPFAPLLRGMIRPAQWADGEFLELSEMKLMAELIALQIWFQLRLDSVDAICDPRIEPNDQVRLLERQTSESAIHYVRGINDSMTISNEGATWTMKLQTNWLGVADKWAITAGDVLGAVSGLPDQFPVSSALAQWLQNRSASFLASRLAAVAGLESFSVTPGIAGHVNVLPRSTQPTQVAVGSQTGTGQGPPT